AFAGTNHVFGNGATSPLFDTLFASPTGSIHWNVMAAFTDQVNLQFDGITSTGSPSLAFTNNGVAAGVSANSQLISTTEAGFNANGFGEYNPNATVPRSGPGSEN